jgi:hypothetical protein
MILHNTNLNYYVFICLFIDIEIHCMNTGTISDPVFFFLFLLLNMKIDRQYGPWGM